MVVSTIKIYSIKPNWVLEITYRHRNITTPTLDMPGYSTIGMKTSGGQSGILSAALVRNWKCFSTEH